MGGNLYPSPQLTTIFYDSFTGADGPLGGHSPEVGNDWSGSALGDIVDNELHTVDIQAGGTINFDAIGPAYVIVGTFTVLTPGIYAFEHAFGDSQTTRLWVQNDFEYYLQIEDRDGNVVEQIFNEDPISLPATLTQLVFPGNSVFANFGPDTVYWRDPIVGIDDFSLYVGSGDIDDLKIEAWIIQSGLGSGGSYPGGPDDDGPVDPSDPNDPINPIGTPPTDSIGGTGTGTGEIGTTDPPSGTPGWTGDSFWCLDETAYDLEVNRYAVLADVRFVNSVDSDAYFGVLGRADHNDESFYYFRLFADGDVEIGIYQNSTFTVLASDTAVVTITDGVWISVAIEILYNTIKGFVDGVEVLSVTDDDQTFLRIGCPGFMVGRTNSSQEIEWRNIQVIPYSPPPPDPVESDQTKIVTEAIAFMEEHEVTELIYLTEPLALVELLNRWDKLIKVTDEMLFAEVVRLQSLIKLTEPLAMDDQITLLVLIALQEQMDFEEVLYKIMKETEAMSFNEVLSLMQSGANQESLAFAEKVTVIKSGGSGTFKPGVLIDINLNTYYEL